MKKLVENWVEGKELKVVNEIMTWSNSHSACLDFCKSIPHQDALRFLHLVKQWEEDAYYGGKDREQLSELD